jgi:hypothetical protein
VIGRIARGGDAQLGGVGVDVGVASGCATHPRGLFHLRGSSLAVSLLYGDTLDRVVGLYRAWLAMQCASAQPYLDKTTCRPEHHIGVQMEAVYYDDL